MENINYNYDTVSPTILEKMKACCLENNHDLVFASHLSCHPDDDYLYVVLAKSRIPANPALNYTLWEFNDGLFWGHYGLDFKAALEMYAKKINWFKD